MLALFPLPASPFKAKFAETYTVEKQVSDQNLITTRNSRLSCAMSISLSDTIHMISVASDSVAQEVVVDLALTLKSVLLSLDVPEVRLDREGCSRQIILSCLAG